MKRGRSLQDNARCKNVKGSAESLSLLGGEYPLPNHLFLVAINRYQTTLDAGVSGNSLLPYKFVGNSHEFIRQTGIPAHPCNDDDDGDRTVHAGLLIMVRREQRFNFMAFTHFSCSSCLILLQPIQSYTRAAFVALELIFMKVHLALA